MCGIVGFYNKNKGVNTLKEMLSSLEHRGPDDQGIYFEDNVALGHKRLSIIDLSSAGHQPMFFKNLVIVFNGEIYNYQNIRKELEQFGYNFISNSDTEVILKAFHFWREKAVDKFIGMFSFAIYDKGTNEFFLFRDRVGVKPLYYYSDGDDFAFSSEIRALKRYNKSLVIDKSALQEFFQFGYISSDLSIFQNCFKLTPGHYLVVKDNKISKYKYWDILDYSKIPNEKKESALIDELEELLLDSFSYRMVSDVPVGVFLSGGIDSSLLAAILQKKYGNIRTFTIGFKEDKYDESKYAKKIANYIGTDHHEEILEVELARDLLMHFADIYDEPFGDSSGIPTTLVSAIAKRNGAKVVLSADGGDELFCGYQRYWFAERMGKYTLPIPYLMKQFASNIINSSSSFLIKNISSVHNLEHKLSQTSDILHQNNWQGVYESMLHFFPKKEVDSLLFASTGLTSQKFEEGVNIKQNMMFWDFNRYLPDDILVKVDRATMYNSIEGRDPFLDYRIIEYAASLPFKYKYHDGQSKYILRKILERHIPKEMFERPKKGFAIPLFEWFKLDLKFLFNKYLTKERIDSEGLLNFDYIDKELTKFNTGQHVNVYKLWLILVFEMWYEKWY